MFQLTLRDEDAFRAMSKYTAVCFFALVFAGCNSKAAPIICDVPSSCPDQKPICDLNLGNDPGLGICRKCLNDDECVDYVGKACIAGECVTECTSNTDCTSV